MQLAAGHHPANPHGYLVDESLYSSGVSRSSHCDVMAPSSAVPKLLGVPNTAKEVQP